jgi:hypothetical protein
VNVADFVQRLNAKRSGQGWQAKCPAHNDREPSLSIKEGLDGRTLLHCHAGCSTDNVLRSLGVTHRDLFPVSSLNGVRREKLTGNGSGNGAKTDVSPFDWQRCVEAFTQKHLERLSQWRGYSPEFCSSLQSQKKLVGVHESCLALPVQDRAGIVVGAHCRPKDGKAWFYSPKGIKAAPLIIGELVAGDPIHVFESQWDAFAYMDKSGEWDGIIITRGASNGAMVSGLIPENSTVHVWTQNDPAGGKWQRDVGANTKAQVKRVTIPSQYKDLNDYARAGATADVLLAAILSAELIPQVRSESLTPPEFTQPQPFPLRCLFPACEAMARAICDTVRVLESLPGCCILGILSAAVGRGLQVKSGPNRVTRGNLYILASAESGSGKSETFRHAAKPFQDFEVQRVTAWKTEMKPGLLAEHKVLEAQIATLTKSTDKGNRSTEEIREELREKIAALENVEAKLRTPALSCDDVTSEKLAVLLANNNEQMASLSADALAIIDILLGRYNSKRDRTDEGIYLKAFSGDRCKVDRQSRESVLIESPCLAALWLTQPDKLESLLAERSLSDGGLIPRILACHTRCEAREIVKGIPEISASTENAYANLIRSLIEAYRLADEPYTIETTPEALEALNAHHNNIVKHRRADLRDVTIYAARWNEQAWRLSVVLHAARHGARAYEHKLEIDTANQAIELADWFASQQLEILSATRDKARREIWDRVFTLLADKPEGIRGSDVYRARITCNADEAHALLAAMESEGELSGHDEQPEGGGHVTRIYVRST